MDDDELLFDLRFLQGPQYPNYGRLTPRPPVTVSVEVHEVSIENLPPTR